MKRLVDAHPVLFYCILTFSISWGYFGIDSLMQSGGASLVHPLIVKQFSPAIASLTLIALTRGIAGLHSLLRSIVNWNVGWVWLLLSLLAEPVLFSGIIFSYWAINGEFSLARGMELFATLGSAVGTFLIGLLRWGFSEEVGWRGWMLPKLQSNFSPFSSALLMAAVVTLWHLNPDGLSTILIAREGQYIFGYYPDLVERLILTIPFTMLMNWIFNRSGGSLLAMMVFHSASNTSYVALFSSYPELNSEFSKLALLVCLIALSVVLTPLLLSRRSRNSAVRS